MRLPTDRGQCARLDEGTNAMGVLQPRERGHVSIHQHQGCMWHIRLHRPRLDKVCGEFERLYCSSSSQSWCKLKENRTLESQFDSRRAVVDGGTRENAICLRIGAVFERPQLASPWSKCLPLEGGTLQRAGRREIGRHTHVGVEAKGGIGQKTHCVVVPKLPLLLQSRLNTCGEYHGSLIADAAPRDV
jgi:hypothetical protein